MGEQLTAAANLARLCIHHRRVGGSPYRLEDGRTTCGFSRRAGVALATPYFSSPGVGRDWSSSSSLRRKTRYSVRNGLGCCTEAIEMWFLHDRKKSVG